MFWTYMRKCTSHAKLAENLSAEDAMRGWKIIVDTKVKPYSALYGDWEIINLVRDLEKRKRPLPADEMLVGPDRSIGSVKRAFYRLNPAVKRRHEREDNPSASNDVCDEW